jgi:hypothetical protein
MQTAVGVWMRFWTTDLSYNDFFNRLAPSTSFGECGLREEPPRLREGLRRPETERGRVVDVLPRTRLYASPGAFNGADLLVKVVSSRGLRSGP